MITKLPKPAAITALILFVGFCVGIALLLWVLFAGPVPLGAQAYRIDVPLREAPGVVAGTSVRIAGIDVGEVRDVSVDAEGGGVVAELEIDPDYAPRPVDTTAIVRRKSLLGEGYVELSAGSASEPALPEGASLPRSQVRAPVSIGKLLMTFDHSTRSDLSTWLTSSGAALDGSAPSLSAAVARYEPFVSETRDTLDVVRGERQATSDLIRSWGGVSDALRGDGQLHALVTNANQMFAATAARDRELAETVRIMPTFLREAGSTSEAIGDFSTRATPLLEQLRPSARALEPVLSDLDAVSPDLEGLMDALEPLERAAKRGTPALGDLLGESEPLLARAKPYLGGVVPILDYVYDYRRELAAFLGNAAATTQATLPAAGGGAPLHYVRGSLPISAATLAAYPRRTSSGRSNPYPAPGDALDLRKGLPEFGSYLCIERPLPNLSPALDPEIASVIPFYYTDDPDDTPAALSPPRPPCRDEGPLGPRVDGGDGFYPHLEPLP